MRSSSSSRSFVRVGSMSASSFRARGMSMSAGMADLPENGNVLFAGRLLSVTKATGEIQIQNGAIAFLQRLADPLLVVSVHGAKVGGLNAN